MKFLYSFFEIPFFEQRKILSNQILKSLIKKYFVEKSSDSFLIKANTILVAGKTFYYSKSYTKNLGIVGVGYFPIGVDIEYIKPRKVNLRHIASETEIAKSGLDSDSTIDFYKMWCGKEACMKIDQSGFKFTDFHLINYENPNKMIFKKGDGLLKTYNFNTDNYIYSFALNQIYANQHPEFRESFL